ncbi:hypothetical protein D1816_08005 [Aquimarina sp. AD10]|uniref:hypothetical protein n=1 Tax=Aquimarina TaxID=290174 RepID=UPI000E52BD65|nr:MULTISPECIES: hypothetical protein [Aquimarina]AXT60295.1 hypothetical protein D1816_08005 [Aquimarina sp. AD10]RKN01270.1 hypothetical protein D7033_05475 [Aquimarina sp. AD10]
MKQNYILHYCLIALFLAFSSCSKDESDITEQQPESVVAEPDFVENDGSQGLEGDEKRAEEEEAPLLTETNQKGYWNYDYTLLKPSELSQSDVKNLRCKESKVMPLLVGQNKKKVGKVIVSNDDENLYLTFKADKNKFMKKVYLYIGEKGNIPFYSNGFPKLWKFNFKAFPYYFGGTKKATYVIPLSSINLDCFEIVAYSKVYDKDSNCLYSAFAYNKNLTQEYYYSYYSGCFYYKDWVRSFEYCVQKCEAECIQAYGYHDACGICENDVFNTFLAYGFIAGQGERGFNIEILTNPNGCDISNSTEVGRINVSSISETKLRIKYELDAGYEMCELSFNYGAFRFTTPNNVSQQFDTPTTTYSFEIDKLTGTNIYMNSEAKITEVSN